MAVNSKATQKALLNAQITTNGAGNVTASKHRIVEDSDIDSSIYWADQVLDEDDLASDSALHIPTQQSVKAYVDAITTSGILRATVNIPGVATLRGIGTAPVQIIATPGANKYLNIMSITVSYNFGTTNYDFSANSIFRFVGGGDEGWLFYTSNYSSSADRHGTITIPTASGSVLIAGITFPSNTAFEYGTTDNTDATTGDGDLDIVIYYTIEDANT